MNVQIDVSVIFVNYNTKDMTINAINSVFEKTEGVSFEVIVVDNKSSDGSLDEFRKVFGSKIKTIDAGDNLGFGRANNLGAAAACGEYLFLLNTDTLLVNNAIKILYDFLTDNSAVAVAGGNLYNNNMNPIHSYREKLPSIKDFGILTKILNRKRIDKAFNFTSTPKAVGYITGADMMIRKKVFDEVGGFDKDFFLYAEECELTYRINKFGYKSYSVPQAKVIHLEGMSSNEIAEEKGFKPDRFRNFLDGNFLYYKKVYGERYAIKFAKRYIRFLKIVCLVGTVVRKDCEHEKKKIIIIRQKLIEWERAIKGT